jgi:glycerophosphoryl diester phosphodiesterase
MVTLELAGREKPYVMAHRGNRARFPENTLSAFKQAIMDGADILETDLHMTADGEIVCIHDATVDRTTDGTGRVDAMTLDQIRQLNAAALDANLPAEPVPTLSELANSIPPDVGLAVELKDEQFYEHSNTEHLTSVLRDTGIYPRSIALSFHREHLDAVRQVDASFPLGLITLSAPYPVAGVHMIGPFWPLLFINPFYVWWAHRQGQLICPLDPAPEARLWYYRLMKCDALLADDPGKICRALGRG